MGRQHSWLLKTPPTWAVQAVHVSPWALAQGAPHGSLVPVLQELGQAAPAQSSRQRVVAGDTLGAGGRVGQARGPCSSEI